jgi:hypothetical protein
VKFNLFFSYNKSDDFGGYFPQKKGPLLYKSTTLLLVTKWRNFVTKKSWHLYRRCFLEKLAPKLAIFGGKNMLESPYLDHRFFLYVAHYLEEVLKQIYFYLGPIAKFSQVLLMATTITSQN